MAAPIPSHTKLPNDTGNAGFKQVRTQTRVVGGEVVDEHFFIPISQRAKKVFHYSTTALAVQAGAQDAVTTGNFWLQNPAASARDLIIRKIALVFATTNVLTSTIPRIVLAKFTFSGTPSGAITPPTPRKTGDANAADMRMAATGLTVTLGTTIHTFIAPQMHAAGQFFGPPPQVWPIDDDPFEDNDVILSPGQGALLYQPDAGTASDPRRFTVNLRAEEVEP